MDVCYNRCKSAKHIGTWPNVIIFKTQVSEVGTQEI